MGKKQKKQSGQRMSHHDRQYKESEVQSGGASLKELLNSDTLAKLKAQAEQVKEAEALNKAAEAERKAEQERAERKKKENDFSYLLENSDPNWSKYK